MYNHSPTPGLFPMISREQMGQGAPEQPLGHLRSKQHRKHHRQPGSKQQETESGRPRTFMSWGKGMQGYTGLGKEFPGTPARARDGYQGCLSQG
jgi:hypothetical protein